MCEKTIKKIITLLLLSQIIFLSSCKTIEAKHPENFADNEDITIEPNEGLIVTKVNSNKFPVLMPIHELEKPFQTPVIHLSAILADYKFRIFKATPSDTGLEQGFTLSQNKKIYWGPKHGHEFTFIPGEITYIGDHDLFWDLENNTVTSSMVDNEEEILEEINRRYPSLLKKYKFNKVINPSINPDGSGNPYTTKIECRLLINDTSGRCLFD